MKRLQDLDDKSDNSSRSKELPSPRALCHSELAKEIFVDLSEGVSLDVHRNRCHDFQEFHQGGVFQPVVGLWKNVLEVRVFSLNGSHGVIDSLPDICSLGFLKEFLEAGGFGKVKNTFCLIVGLPDLSAARSLAF